MTRGNSPRKKRIIKGDQAAEEMLVDYLIKQNWLQTPRIIKAFRMINRADFLPAEFKDYAEMNQVFPIGWGKNISQPLISAFMLEKLQPRNGENILEIGAGSGWVTALLAEIISQPSDNPKVVSRRGKIIALEAISDLKNLAQKNVSKYGFVEKNLVEFFCADGVKGYPLIDKRTDLPLGFDSIVSFASLKELPGAWKSQVKVGGSIVAFIGSSVWQLVKTGEDKFDEIEYPALMFMPAFGQFQTVRVC